MKYKNLLFDLDGTVSDSSAGVMSSFRFALEQMNIYNGEDLMKVVGPPLRESFELFYGLKDNDVDRGVKLYRRYFRKKGLYENSIFPGMEQLLRKLSSDRHRLFIATNKPTVFAKAIIESYGLSDCFEYISGAYLNGKRGTKVEVIEYILKRYRLNREDTLMIGDRYHDIEGAHSAGIKSLAVLYGCGNTDELSNADYKAETVKDIIKFV